MKDLTEKKKKKDMTKKKNKEGLTKDEKQRLAYLKEMTKAKKLKEIGQPVTHVKPSAIYDYNFDMGGPDRLGQLIDSYDFLRPTVKWTKKFSLWLVSCCLVNAYILHSKFGTTRDLSHYDFRSHIIAYLLEGWSCKLPPAPQNSLLRLSVGRQHLPVRTHPTNIRGAGQRACVACNFSEREQATFEVPLHKKRCSYICRECEVPLCIYPCFTEYHTKEDYKVACLEHRKKEEMEKQAKRAQKKNEAIGLTWVTGLFCFLLWVASGQLTNFAWGQTFGQAIKMLRVRETWVVYISKNDNQEK